MAQRTVAFCDGKYIGIESIYTVINGRQINIPEKLNDLREKSRNNKLFCPCGCGANLVLVAGDKNLREQHFRIKDGIYNHTCNAITEGRKSLESKIVLKCWLDDKLNASDIETRVPIYAIDNNQRKYEFSFLSKEKNIALSYCYDRVNLFDEKLDILESNSKDIHIIYVVDSMNESSNGQYPERLIKIQQKQGYCLLLTILNVEYDKAELRTVFYETDAYGIWREITIASGLLKDFEINSNGTIIYHGRSMEVLLNDEKASWEEKKNKILNQNKTAENFYSFKRNPKIREDEKAKRESKYKRQRTVENLGQRKTQFWGSVENRLLNASFAV